MRYKIFVEFLSGYLLVVLLYVLILGAARPRMQQQVNISSFSMNIGGGELVSLVCSSVGP